MFHLASIRHNSITRVRVTSVNVANTKQINYVLTHILNRKKFQTMRQTMRTNKVISNHSIYRVEESCIPFVCE